MITKIKNISKTVLLFAILMLFAENLSAKIYPVVISEVFYDTPLEEDDRKGKPHHNGEFIELYNPTEEDIDISGWQLQDTKSFFNFPENSIISSKSVVIVSFQYNADFELSQLFPDIPENTQIFYHSGMVLRNEGEEITLYDRGKVVDRMSYRQGTGINGHIELDRVIPKYWDINAQNLRSFDKMLSIQRQRVNWTSSSIQFLQDDYHVKRATPGVVDGELAEQTIEGALYEAGEINTDLAVGTLQGTSAVTPTGAATYNIPIEVPAGTNGFQPELSIAYNSQGGYGALGIGWDIGGLSSISRGMQSFYFDQTSNGTIDATTIKFNNTDRLYIDGQRLILLSDNKNHFDIGAVYGTEQENYVRVEIATDNPATNRIYFILTTKEGTVTEYGRTDNALLKDGIKIMAWRMNKVIDVNGNEINYIYQNNGQYVKSVIYGKNNINEISFIYDDNTKTPQKRNINGFWSKQEKLLQEIEVICGTTTERGYEFGYDNSETFAKLDAIKPFFFSTCQPYPFTMGFCKEYINSTNIEWGAKSSIQEIILGKMPDGNINNLEGAHSYTGDIDGDGYIDKIELWEGDRKNDVQGTIRVILKDKVLPQIKIDLLRKEWKHFKPRLVVGDINNDGKDEIMLIHASREMYTLDNNWSKMFVSVYGINSNNSKLERLNYYSCFNVSYTTGANPTSINGEKIVLYPEYDYIPLLLNMNNDEYPDLVIVPYREKYDDICGGAYVVEKYYGSANGLIQQPHDIINKCSFDGWGNSVIGDFDANGIIDILRVSSLSKGHGHNSNIDDKIKLTVDNSKFGLNLFKNKPLFEELYSIDINNDGFTDILVRQGEKGDKKWHLLRNTGGLGSIPEKIDLNHLHNFYRDYELEGDYAMLIDYNGDGYTDLIIGDDWRNAGAKYKDYEATRWYFYKNTGGGFELEYSKGGNLYFKKDDTEYAGLSRMNPVIMDINGDGVPDLVFGDRQGDRNNRYYKAFTMPNANKRNVVHSITNGFGQKEEFSYKYFTDYTPENPSPASVVRNVKSPIMVVEKHTAIDGTVTTYDFQKPKMHIKGKGFLGFEEVTVKNTKTKERVVSKYGLVNPTKHFNMVLKEQWFYNDTDYPLIYFKGSVIYTNENKPVDNSQIRYIPVITKIVSNDNMKGLSTITTNVYNSDGVLTKETKMIGGATIITEYLNLKKRIPSGDVEYLPQTVKVTNKRTNQPDYVFTSTYTYYDNGSIDIATENEGTYAEIVTDYDYFSTGNLEKVTVTPKNQTERTTTYGYDIPQYRFVTSETNADLNQTVHSEYDNFGRLLYEKDIDDTETLYEYNVFGQLTKKILPTEEEISYKLQWGVSGLFKQIATSNKISGSSETHYNNLGRKFYTETTGWNGAKLKAYTEYDPVSGKVSKVEKPHYENETAVYTSYIYDNLQRIKKETVFDGETNLTTEYNYDGRSVAVTLPNGQTRTSVIDESGLVIERTDGGGTITYTYNALGNPLKIVVNAGGNTSETEIEYDVVGRQIKLIDPNAGDILYEYYADGQLKKQTGANGNITEFTYDIAGRTDTKTVSDFEESMLVSTTITEYSYVESGNGIGQIESIKLKKDGNDIIHSQSVVYNDKHLPETITDIYDEKTFEFSCEYDELLRLKSKTSPSGLTITNDYNDYGDLIKIKKGEIVIWEGNEQNSNGQFTQYALGNSATTTKTYNRRGETTGIQTKIEENFIQDNFYEYEALTGNLKTRNDFVNNRYERFEYDELDRLTQGYFNTNNVFDYSEQERQFLINYYDNGNIDEKSDVGKYKYEAPRPNYDTPRPNAVSGIEVIETEHDEGITEEKQFITYNAFNKVSSIRQGIDENSITKSYYIYYGLDEQRIKTEYFENENGEDVLKLTRYYIGSYELDIDENNNETDVDYISASSGLAAIIKNNVVYYAYTDRQGSLERITDENGTLVSNYAYTAWGGRILIDGINITDRGYTGHEHLSPFGDDTEGGFCLINMNGRIYDPVLARFLSPDPYIQASDFTQAYNRYSYCWNNPFKYTDPDGEWVWLIPAVVGGVINLVSNLVSGQVDTFWEGLAYFGIGAAAGLGTFFAPQAYVAISAATSAANNFTNQSFDVGVKNVNYWQVGFSAIVGAATSYAGGWIGKAIGTDKWFAGITSPFLRETLKGMSSNAVVGGIFGTFEALANGTDPWKGMLKGAGMGTMTGTISGIGNGVISSHQNQVNFLNGKKIYPKNDGFQGTPQTLELQPGQVVDRYGGTGLKSDFLAPEGTSIGERSLHPNTNFGIYERYVVEKPISVQAGQTAPFYGQPGMGIQYQTPQPIQTLTNEGFLRLTP